MHPTGILTADGERVELTKSLIVHSATIKNAVDDCVGQEECEDIALPNVSAKTLRKVIVFCDHEDADPEPTGYKVSAWGLDYCSLPNDELFALVVAANFLDIPPLTRMLCNHIADMIKGKDEEEICEALGIPHVSPTDAELQEVREQHPWIQEL